MSDCKTVALTVMVSIPLEVAAMGDGVRFDNSAGAYPYPIPSRTETLTDAESERLLDESIDVHAKIWEALA